METLKKLNRLHVLLFFAIVGIILCLRYGFSDLQWSADGWAAFFGGDSFESWGTSILTTVIETVGLWHLVTNLKKGTTEWYAMLGLLIVTGLFDIGTNYLGLVPRTPAGVFATVSPTIIAIVRWLASIIIAFVEWILMILVEAAATLYAAISNE